MGVTMRDWTISKKGSQVDRIDLPSGGLHFRGEFSGILPVF